MLLTLPTEPGMGELLAYLFATITLGTAIMSAALYYILLKKTTYVFVSEIFSMLAIALIVLTITTFPYG